MPFDHLRQLWLSRTEKTKDDHIACLPYACLLGKFIRQEQPAGTEAVHCGRPKYAETIEISSAYI
jgi:hypothetical protein